MSVVRTCLSTALAGCLLAGGAVAAAGTEPAGTEPAGTEPAASAPAPERLLFIGNSHTERHGGMDWLVGSMVNSFDPALAYDADAQTEKGATLEYHFRNGAPRAIRAKDYDTVVIQGYIPGSPTETTREFRQYASLLGDAVLDAGARPVFYMTWPQERRRWTKLEDIVAVHREVAAELGADVAPVAIAFDLAQTERPDLELIEFDGVHATWEGAYLAALTLFATLYRTSPLELDHAFGLSADDAAFLKHIAAQAITDWQAGATT